MSLISGLNITFQGIRDTEAKLAVSTANVTNADKPGYTRKEYESNYTTIGDVTTPINGTVQSVVIDKYIQAQLVEDISYAAFTELLADYMASYVSSLGSTNGESTLNAGLDNLASSLSALAQSPENASLKSQVITDAVRLADELRTLSTSVQNLRHQADQEIGDAVDSVNQSLLKIDELNERIATAHAQGDSTADMEDERRVELENIAENIDIDYYINSDNQVRIYTAGRTLLGSDPHLLSYTPSSAVTSSVVYPGGFSELTIDGYDITPVVDGGAIGAMIEMRDVSMVQEQEKLDEFANVLMNTMNSLLNQGASIPSRSPMVGEVEGFSAGAGLTATGSVRIATTDQNGVVMNYSDFNLAGYATVGDLITDINTVLGPDVTASIDADGKLQLTANNAGEGISLNELDSSVGASNQGFSDFFGLNGLFHGTGAENIRVDDYLVANSDYLATSRLSSDPALVAGDTGIFVGDGSLSEEMNNAITTATSFAAAGNFAARTISLDAYADDIMTNIATRASQAESEAETAELYMKQTRDTVSSVSGVNIDEEMTNVIDLEAKYGACATLITTIQGLFDELLASVR